MGKLIHGKAIQERLQAVQEEHGDVVELMQEQDAADLFHRPDYGDTGMLETGLELGMKANGRDVVYVEIFEEKGDEDDAEACPWSIYWIGTEKEVADRVEIFLCDLAVNRGEISVEEA